MAQQPLLALQVKPIDMPTYRGIMDERDTYRKQQNAMAQEQLKQQQNAMRQMIYRQNVDASGNINQQGIIRGLAQAGLGAEIPEQMKAYGQGVEATAKGGSEQYKLGQSFLTSAHDIIYNAATPEDAIAASVQYAQQHPGHPELMQGVTRLAGRIKNMTPEEFAAAKPGILSENLTAQQRLEQSFSTQNLGGSTRVLAMSKYGAGGASVVPGSEAQVTMTPQQQYAAQNPAGKVVQDNNGNYVVVNTRIPGPVMTGGGGIPGQRGGGDFGSFKSAVVQTESRGDYTALSPKGALGAYQVMPATAKTLAGRLGLPWNPELMRSNTPEGRQYQDAIGNAAAQEAWQASGGDPARAAAYYHGGSDTSKWGPKTQAYAQAVTANMGRAPAAGAAPGQLQGPPKGGKAATDDKSAKALTEFEASVDKQIAQIDKLINHKGLPYITGSFRGRAPSAINAMPSVDIGNYRIGGGGQDADDAQALLEAIQANATLTELQKLKQSGTSLGQVAVYEDKMLGAAAAVTKQTQGTETMRASLRDYKRLLLESKKRIREEAAKGAAGADTAAPQRKPLDAFKRR